MPGTIVCHFCGAAFGDQTSCPECTYRYMKFVEKQMLPYGVKKRFFYLQDYQELYLLAKQFKDGEISQEEKDKQVHDKWQQILQHQEYVLENERRMNEEYVQDDELL